MSENEVVSTIWHKELPLQGWEGVLENVIILLPCTACALKGSLGKRS